MFAAFVLVLLARLLLKVDLRLLLVGLGRSLRALLLLATLLDGRTLLILLALAPLLERTLLRILLLLVLLALVLGLLLTLLALGPLLAHREPLLLEANLVVPVSYGAHISAVSTAIARSSVSPSPTPSLLPPPPTNTHGNGPPLPKDDPVVKNRYTYSYCSDSTGTNGTNTPSKNHKTCAPFGPNCLASSSRTGSASRAPRKKSYCSTHRYPPGRDLVPSRSIIDTPVGDRKTNTSYGTKVHYRST